MKIFKNKNILITGASGFLGGHTCEQLVQMNANVTLLFNDYKMNNYVFNRKLDKKVNIVYSDINASDKISEIISKYEINYIFHYAANSIVKKCVDEPLNAFRTNILGTATLLEACKKNIDQIDGFLCMESDKSYGSFDEKDLPYKEDQPIKPKHIYEVSKACAGMVSMSYYHNFDLPVFIVRAANLYGPGDFNLSRIVPKTIYNINNNLDPILYEGVGSYIREFLYVEDAASIIIQLMSMIKEIKGQIINIGSGEKISINDFMNLLIKISNKKVKIKLEKKDILFKEIEKQYLDIEKFKRILPEFQITKLEFGLSKTFNWYLNYFNNL